jgi:pectinesterase
MLKLYVQPGEDIQAILDRIPAEESVEIFFSEGIFRQKLRLSNDGMRIIGTGAEKTFLIYNDYAWKYHSDGKLYNTFRTPTLSVFGNGIEIQGLTIANDAGFGPPIGQAVALAVYGDQVKVKDCHLLGHQDTLFCGPLPPDLRVRYQGFLPEPELRGAMSSAHFHHCLIAGDVDFIFGSATAWFEECELQILGPGFISAPSTAETEPYGFLFTECRIRNLSEDPRVYLGRPWRTGGASLFLDCVFEGSFASNRWDAWDKPRFRFFEHPYVFSPLGKPLTGEETERVRTFLTERFTRS